MEQVKMVLMGMELDIVDYNFADEQVRENAAELIQEEIDGLLVELEGESGNDAAFLLESVVPHLVECLKALKELEEMSEPEELGETITIWAYQPTRAFITELLVEDLVLPVHDFDHVNEWIAGRKELWRAFEPEVTSIEWRTSDTTTVHHLVSLEGDGEVTRCQEEEEDEEDLDTTKWPENMVGEDDLPEVEEEIRTVEQLMVDYALWVGTTVMGALVHPQENLTPMVYIEEFMQMAFQPPRKLVEAFLRQFYGVDVIEHFTDTIAWDK